MIYNEKVVVVTGGAMGIGRSICLEYACKLAKVIIADINEEEAIKTIDTIKKNNGFGVFYKVDVSKTSEIENFIKNVDINFGRIDILINNVGISVWKSPYNLEVAEWDKVINTNLRSVFLCSREAALIMKRNGGGSIVNISSTRAFMSEPHSEAYAASKGGIIALTHALAASLGPDNIQVNAISPGWIETRDYESLKEIDHKQHFSGRVGKPEDIAAACLYLTAPGNNFITGTNITIDGGMTRKMIYEP